MVALLQWVEIRIEGHSLMNRKMGHAPGNSSRPASKAYGGAKNIYPLEGLEIPQLHPYTTEFT